MKLPFPGGHLCVLAAGSRENARWDAVFADRGKIAEADRTHRDDGEQ